MCIHASKTIMSLAGICACAAFLLCGSNAIAEEPAVPGTNAEPVPAPNTNPSPTSNATPVPVPADNSEVDLIGDKPAPGSATADPKELLDVMKPDGPLNPTARRCYYLIGEMKSNIEKVSVDLDNNGKEVQRLIRTSDALSKNITDLADLWPNDQFFRDACINTKRQVLVLNDELARVPRKWTHVRWAFNGSLREVSKLRTRARDMAESEPKPVPLIGKDGKPVTDREGNQVYIEPQNEVAVDPIVAKRDKAKREVEAAREQDRNRAEQKKNKAMPTDLDSR